MNQYVVRLDGFGKDGTEYIFVVFAKTSESAIAIAAEKYAFRDGYGANAREIKVRETGIQEVYNGYADDYDVIIRNNDDEPEE